ncbi:melanoma antigen recognized by T-cells 1 [Lepisosteus oculatus]|uniref:Melan-A n=1 Tax=Lepisosteus oculatus TaxID=7918 RepID=W5MVB6_LEPOC|nr:PREDICTED: melanoma antigen recognized by T-cells 1 [Lepisosteus oculatus]
MPRGEFTVQFSSRGTGGGSYVRAEEAAGIALLVIILAALLIIGCWYYKRRRGYKSIRSQGLDRSSFRSLMKSDHYSEEGASAENKVVLSEFHNLNSVVPSAPPPYEKIASGPSPPPYSA